MKAQRISHKEWLEIYSKVPRICVDLVVKGKDGIVLTKRQIYPYEGYWHTPGAGIIFGEKIKEVVERVAKTELNIKVKFIKIIDAVEFRVIKNYGHSISLFCLCEPLSNRMSGSEQAREIAYFKVAPPKMIPEQRDFLIKHKFLKNA